MANNTIILVFVSILSIYILFGLYLFFFQKSFIYFPSQKDFWACQGFADGEKIEHKGTRFYYKQHGKNLAIFYHGNAASACDRTYMKKIFEKANVSYIIVEYAGYGNDRRQPNKELLFKDVENVNDFIKELHYSKLILAGESLGTALAGYHATLKTPDKILLITPFTTLADMARVHYWWYPVSLLLTEDYDTIGLLKGYRNQAAIVHGSADEIIPVSMSKRLFEAIPSKSKKFIEIEGSSHNDLFLHDKTEEGIIKFIKS